MRSALEHDLCGRDAALPGLAVALDADGFVARLRAALPEAGILGGEITYLRYKPATNCLVTYRLRCAHGPVDVYAKAHTPAALHKLRKVADRATAPSPLGPGRLVLPELALTVCAFPNDDKLRALVRLADARLRGRLLRRVFEDRPALWDAVPQPLRYKPERRCVAALVPEHGDDGAVLRFYADDEHAAALRGAEAFASRGPLRVARLLGSSRRHRIVGLELVPGRPLTGLLPEPVFDAASLARVGAALAELHDYPAARLACRRREEELAALSAAAAAVGAVLPRLADRAGALARELGSRLAGSLFEPQPVHGDFYAGQVLLDGDRAVLLDLDRAALGDAAGDLGNFAAHLERDALEGRVPASRVAEAREALLDGYQTAARPVHPARLALHTAVGLLRLAPEPFRRFHDDWPARTEALLDRAEELAAAARPRHGAPRGLRRDAEAIVRDEPGAAADPAMPFLAAATDPAQARRYLLGRLDAIGGAADDAPELRAIRVTRWKAGRRCLVEYDLAAPHAITLVGKARARGTDAATFRLLRFLWRNGFAADSAHGVSVPEPLVLVPEFRMGVLRKVGGEPATDLLAGAGGVALARRIAEAAHRLHRADAPTWRRHTRDDELAILRDRLGRVAAARPEWAGRIERLLDACSVLAAGIRDAEPCGIHRDFHPDQVLVDGARLHLLDFDLYCAGDPALDVGNFAAHLTEYGLRALGDPAALDDRVAALEDRFVELAGEGHRDAVRAYAMLSLARHVYISTRVAARREFTAAILELCEARLGLAARPGGRRAAAGRAVAWRVA